jgi:hypothetical protein
MKFVTHQTTLHLSFKIKCCVDRLRPPPNNGHKATGGDIGRRVAYHARSGRPVKAREMIPGFFISGCHEV